MRGFCNSKFRENLVNEAESLPKGLEAIISIGFGECNGVIYARELASPTPESIADLMKPCMDLTGVECFFNKIHIEDFSGEETVNNHNINISHGLKFINCMSLAIKKIFPDDPIRFILSEKAGEFPSVVFRFHRKRSGESWISEDIEGYDNGLYILDTD